MDLRRKRRKRLFSLTRRKLRLRESWSYMNPFRNGTVLPVTESEVMTANRTSEQLLSSTDCAVGSNELRGCLPYDEDYGDEEISDDDSTFDDGDPPEITNDLLEEQNRTCDGITFQEVSDKCHETIEHW